MLPWYVFDMLIVSAWYYLIGSARDRLGRAQCASWYVQYCGFYNQKKKNIIEGCCFPPCEWNPHKNRLMLCGW